MANTFIFVPNYFKPIAFWEYPIFIITALIGAFILNSVIEYGVLYDLSKAQKVNKRDLFITVILVNLVTFPPAQLLFYCSLAFSFIFILPLILVIEIIIIVFESKLYYFEFQKHIQENSYKISLTSKIVLRISVVINLLSFLVLLIINSYLINAFWLYSRYI